MDENQTSTQQGVEATQSEVENQQEQGNETQTQETGASTTGEQSAEATTTTTEETQTGEQGGEQGGEQRTRLEKRQARYIDKLTDKLGAYRNQQTQAPLNNQNTYKPIEYGEQEYQIADLEKDRQQYGEMQRQQGLSQAQDIARTTVWRDSVDRDNDYIDRKYPMLDENSPEFDPDIANLINQQFLQVVGFNGSTVANPIRYRHFVEAQFELADRFATSRNAETAQNVARQAAQTSVKTGSNTRKGSRDWSEPGAIAALTPEEYQKHKPEIEAFMKTIPPISTR
jgi:uncharacterized protein YerC